MKFTTVVSFLAVAASLVSAIPQSENCAPCQKADSLTKCSAEWVDAVNQCMNPPCNHHYSQNPVYLCTSIVASNTAAAGTGARATGTASTTTVTGTTHSASTTTTFITSTGTTHGNSTGTTTGTTGINSTATTSSKAVTSTTAKGSAATGGVMGGMLGVVFAVGLGGLAIL